MPHPFGSRTFIGAAFSYRAAPRGLGPLGPAWRGRNASSHGLVARRCNAGDETLDHWKASGPSQVSFRFVSCKAEGSNGATSGAPIPQAALTLKSRSSHITATPEQTKCSAQPREVYCGVYGGNQGLASPKNRARKTSVAFFLLFRGGRSV